MIEMGRKSIAQKIIESLPKQDVVDQEYIVAYDFLGGPPNPRFYSSLHRIIDMTGNGSKLTQFSVYRTMSLKATLAVHALAIREGAEVQVYAVSETTPEDLRALLDKAQPEAEKEGDF